MNPVPPYCGQNQTSSIPVPARIAYNYIDWEEGPWVMIPYASLYPQPPAPTQAPLPPPVGKIDLWSAMQVWPL
jgi:hypothetical protein